jgi:hypothetical protein
MVMGLEKKYPVVLSVKIIHSGKRTAFMVESVWGL